jgi:hypothetical protein
LSSAFCELRLHQNKKITVVFARVLQAKIKDGRMKMFQLYVFVIAIVGGSFLNSCANQAAQNPTTQSSAATAPTPPPQNFRNMPGTGMRGGY